MTRRAYLALRQLKQATSEFLVSPQNVDALTKWQHQFRKTYEKFPELKRMAQRMYGSK